MDHTIEYSIPADDDGFIELSCPHCSERFKLTADYLQERDAPTLWCAVCGLELDAQGFLPDEVFDAARTHAENVAADLINQFSKDLAKVFRGSKSVTVTGGRKLPKKPIPETRQVPDYEAIEFACCDVSAKVHAAVASGISYCSNCGLIRTGEDG